MRVCLKQKVGGARALRLSSNHPTHTHTHKRTDTQPGWEGTSAL